MISKFRNIILIALFPLLFVSCEELKNIVKDFSIKKYVNNQSDVMLVSSVQVDLYDLLGIDLQLPTGVRRDISIGKLGRVGRLFLDIDNRVSLHINLSTLVNNIELHQTGLKLPNGRKLPMIGDDEAFRFPIKIGTNKDTNLDLYLSFIKGKVVLGFTIGIDVPVNTRTDLMGRFKVKKLDIQAGAFVGPNKGETGIAAFFDITDLIGYRIVDRFGQDVRFELLEKEDTELYYRKPSRRDSRILKRAVRKLKRKGVKSIVIN